MSTIMEKKKKHYVQQFLLGGALVSSMLTEVEADAINWRQLLTKGAALRGAGHRQALTATARQHQLGFVRRIH